MTVAVNLNKTVDSSYQIHIGQAEPLRFDSKVAVVTNPTIAALHLDTIKQLIDAPSVCVIMIPDGEEYKLFSSVEKILDRLFMERFDRSSVLLAFGGGVVGDMTGFAASIYERGIDFVQVPTTLLAMVDASVGGKTGINNRYGKNLIGTFKQPRGVVIDPNWLWTLPKREFNSGVSEMIKIAIMLDQQFFEFLETADLQLPEVLEEAITRSVKLKAGIVEKDERESGLRQVLNYGHTFAHVIERETNYTAYLHGECVAMGIKLANRLAVKLGLLEEADAKRVESALERFGLNIVYRTPDPEAFYEAFSHDKKSSGGKINFVLARAIGDFAFVDDAPKATVLEAIRGQ
ncbi:3-dehydroquinate synthase [Campylobacterota bacterium]|nr:3-dehydroquinate synthase [Campylobacterota bacterium]